MANPKKITTGKQVIALRTSLNMSQKGFAEALGCSLGTIHKMEKDGPTTENHLTLIEAAKDLPPAEEEVKRGRPAVPVDEKAMKMLASIRENKGLSLKGMGELINYSGPMVHAFEQGYRGIPDEVKGKLSKLAAKNHK